MLDVKLHFLALCDELTVLSHEPVDFIDVKVDGHLDVARRTKSCATPAATLGSRMRFRTSISRMSSLFFSDDQVYVCIVQTASTGFEQIALKLNDLHMETVRDIVDRRALPGLRSHGPPHYQALWRGGRASQRSESVSVVSLQELRRSSPASGRWLNAPLDAFHDLLVDPSRRLGAVLLHQQHRENGLGLQAV